MKFNLTFRVPPSAREVKRHWDGTEFGYIKLNGAPAQAKIEVDALHERQAWVIGQSIAKRNGWSLSSQPRKVVR